MRPLFLLLALTAGGCDKVKDLKAFFQAQPLDDKTALEIDTTPRIGGSLSGALNVDGTKVADKTPHTMKPLPPGKHTVRVEAKGYISQEMEIDAKEGQVTQLSLALKPLPGTTPPRRDPVSTNDGGNNSFGKKKHGKGEKDEPDEPQDKNDATVHVEKTLLVTTTPAQAVFLDGASVGTGTGLKLQVTRTAGDLKIGDGDLVLSYTNKRTGLKMKVKDLGDRSVVVDGNAITAKKTFDVDTRPKRVEVTSIEGKKIVLLMKLVE